MTTYPLDVTLEVCANGLLGFIGLLFLFALNRDDIPSGFRLLPRSRREWLAYYFHTLEAVTIIGLWICGIRRGHYIPWAFPVTIVSFTLVFLSALFTWRWDRRRCYAELLFCVVAFILAGFAFPVIAITKDS